MGRSRGFAFVTYERERDAEDAVEDLDDRDFMSRRIKVNKARAREGGPRGGGGPPRYGGGGGGGGGRSEMCRDFERGNCNRGSSCRFEHGSGRSRSRSRSRSRDRRR